MPGEGVSGGGPFWRFPSRCPLIRLQEHAHVSSSRVASKDTSRRAGRPQGGDIAEVTQPAQTGSRDGPLFLGFSDPVTQSPARANPTSGLSRILAPPPEMLQGAPSLHPGSASSSDDLVGLQRVQQTALSGWTSRGDRSVPRAHCQVRSHAWLWRP